MRRFVAAAIAAATASLPILAGPQAGAATRSSSACTHHPIEGGPQVCIRVEGTGTHVDKAVAIWTNPPAGVNERTAHLFLSGHEVHYPQRATRHGSTLSAEWGWFEHSGELCVEFDGIRNRRACEDVYDSDHA
ncbi:hypothetical protein [Kitasatospora sp. A2-31]|uniref:hypothetical protein n=1 Tax=Kitasatospora sp. A2-31 TaxID=2916414 RepID=UPI001EEB2E44|nr:hypothetical protein [Kitasatospora sp. A2-31]MCG6497954.1 hypothetical protein [Kitasatospora sp. A2-31]